MFPVQERDRTDWLLFDMITGKGDVCSIEVLAILGEELLYWMSTTTDEGVMIDDEAEMEVEE